MNKKWFLLCILVLGLFAGVVVTHGGGWGGVSAKGGSLHVQGEGFGLGQVDEAQIEATLTGYLVCTNHGTNTAPGQNSFTTTLEQSQNVTVRNGRFSFSFDFTDADFGFASTDWEAAGCPNANWTVDYLHQYLTFTLHEIENGVAVDRTAATFSCVMNPPALSGDYVCTQS